VSGGWRQAPPVVDLRAARSWIDLGVGLMHGAVANSDGEHEAVPRVSQHELVLLAGSIREIL
jgi:hypothetical protein